MDQNVFLAIMVCLSTSQNAAAVLFPYIMFILSIMCKIKLYKISNKEKVNYIIQHIKTDFCSSFDENDSPFGVVIHRNKDTWFPHYMCWVPENDYEKSIYILSTDSIRKYLIKAKNPTRILSTPKKENPDIIQDKTEHELTYFSQYGSYNFIRYQSRTIILPFEFTAKQKELSEPILELYQDQKRGVVFISGPIGIGKTMLSFLIAKEIKASICDTFTGTEPGSFIEEMYSRISPSESSPLVLLMDEVDVALYKIHNETITRHKNIPIQLRDKTSWNLFMDTLGRGVFPYMLVILCSNKSIKEINEQYDPCYLRKGRTDLLLTMY